MTPAERARLGGQATLARYGREHFVALGKRGFAELGTYARGGRGHALHRLASWGKIRLRHPVPTISEAELAALYREVGLD